MINHNGAWLPSVSIWPPVLIGIATILLGTAVTTFFKGIRADKNDVNDSRFLNFMIFGFATAFFLTIVGTSIGGYWPAHADYHKLQPVTGTVSNVDSRFLTTSEY